MRKRTRLGKEVGSVKTNPDGWMVWPEGGRFVLVAPSGARWKPYDTEEEANRERDARNAEWFA